MLSEFGILCLYLAFMCATLQGVLPWLGVRKKQLPLQRLAIPLSLWQWLFLSLSICCLILSFWRHDFTLPYVAAHSQQDWPASALLFAFMKGPEGQALLWCGFLSLWNLLFLWRGRAFSDSFRARVLSLLGWLQMPFIAYVLGASNPLQRLHQAPPWQGQGELTSHIGFLPHVLLSLGFSGFGLVFCLSLASLFAGHRDGSWLRWIRPWVGAALGLSCTGFTLDVALSLSENPSFDTPLWVVGLPLLSGIALLHMVSISEIRNLYTPWTYFLAVLSFLLCASASLITQLLDAPLTAEVESVAQRTRWVQLIMASLLCWGLLSWLLTRHRSPEHAPQKGVSRERLIFAMSLILSLCGVVLLFDQAPSNFTWWSTSTSNWFGGGLLGLLLLLVALSPGSRWAHDRIGRLLKIHGVQASLALALTLFWVYQSSFSTLAPWAWGLVFLAIFVLISNTLWFIYAAYSRKKPNDPLDAPRLPIAARSMAHVGFALLALWAVFQQHLSHQSTHQLSLQEVATLPLFHISVSGQQVIDPEDPTDTQLTITFSDAAETPLTSVIAHFKEGSRASAWGSALIGLNQVSVKVERRLSERRWRLVVHYTPLIGCFWLGALCVSLGVLLAHRSSRYRLRQRQAAQQSTSTHHRYL